MPMPSPSDPDLWRLRPGDLPAQRTRARERRLRGLEENPVFRALNFGMRGRKREAFPEFFSPLQMKLAIYTLALSVPIIMLHGLLVAATHPTILPLWNPVHLMRFTRATLLLTNFWLILGLLLFVVLTARYLGSTAFRVATFGVSRGVFSDLREVPDAAAHCTRAFWGRAVSSRNLLFLRLTCAGLLALTLGALLFVFPHVEDYYPLALFPLSFDYLAFPPLLFCLGVAWTAPLVGTARGPHILLYGVRAFAREHPGFLAELRSQLHDLKGTLFLWAARPGDLLYLTAGIQCLLLFAALHSMSPFAADARPAPASVLMALLQAPAAPLVLGALVGAWIGAVGAYRARRDAAAIIAEIDGLFQARLHALSLLLFPELERTSCSVEQSDSSEVETA